MTAMTEAASPANGVQDLIDRIRDRGVAAARTEAEQILRDAEARAAKLLADCTLECQRHRTQATAAIAAEQAAALEALKLSARDTVLHLKSQVSAAFEVFVRRLVTDATADEDLIRALVLVLAGHAVDEFIQDKDIQVMISGALLTGEAEESLRERSRQNILALSTGMLREGVELIPAEGMHGGARVRLVADHLEIDLSDTAITRLLSQSMLPRFRRILDGVE
jgi:V/A-type H+-transporting ATPase subunit E